MPGKMTAMRVAGRAARILQTLIKAKRNLDAEPGHKNAPKWINQIQTLAPALKNLKEYGDTVKPSPPAGVEIEFNEKELKPKAAKWWPF